jgi:fucose permease
MKNRNAFSVFSLFLAFLCMGFGDAAGQLVSVVKSAFGISSFMASFVSFFGMIMFGLLSIPLGIIQSKKGKKLVLMMGLGSFFLGTIFPIFSFSFVSILMSVFFMGAGAAMLQVSGQPVMRDVSPVGKFSRNLSFAQSVKAVGTLSTSLIIFIIGEKLITHSWFALTAEDGHMVNAGFRLLFPIFALIILVTMIFIFPLRLQNREDEQNKVATLSSCFNALKTPFILAMVVGIFFYCGAEASLFNKIPDLSPVLKSAGNIVLICALVIGRFLGGVVLNRLKPIVFLIITAIAAVFGHFLLFMPLNNTLLWMAVGLIGLSLANIFPLIFSITVDRFPEKANEISGLMVTAIVGAAIIPLVTGWLTDELGLIFSFSVPLICIFYVLFTALAVRKKTYINS